MAETGLPLMGLDMHVQPIYSSDGGADDDDRLVYAMADISIKDRHQVSLKPMAFFEKHSSAVQPESTANNVDLTQNVEEVAARSNTDDADKEHTSCHQTGLPDGEYEQHADMDGATQPHEAPKTQICFDFTKGLCTRGDKCKYTHDLATIVHFNSKEKGICFDYLRNQCQRGLLCRFSHDLSNIAQQCQVFNGTATKGRTNAICYDFVKGVCQRGSECRYSHDLSLIARTARGGANCQRPGEVCYDYLRGRCSRGASCKYSHNMSFLAPEFVSSGDSTNISSHAGTESMGGAPMQQPNGLIMTHRGSAPGGYPHSTQLHSYGGAEHQDGEPRTRGASAELSDTLTGRSDQVPQAMWPSSAMSNQPAMHPAAFNRMAQQRHFAAAQHHQFAAAAAFNGYAQQLQHQQFHHAAASAQAAQLAASAPAEHMAHGLAVAARAAAMQGTEGVVPGAAGMYTHSAEQMMRSYPPVQGMQFGPGGPMMTQESMSVFMSNFGNKDPVQVAEALKNWASMATHRQAAGQRMSEGGIKSASSAPSAPQQIPSRSDGGANPSALAESFSLPNQGPKPSAEMLSRTAPTNLSKVIPDNLPPDLMPLLKEIWNK